MFCVSGYKGFPDRQNEIVHEAEIRPIGFDDKAMKENCCLKSVPASRKAME